ncbi:hypothetical protein AYO44_12685 [Planctomycetaceae bacterium SCGC AG-212-F19]|nr:hypothetical protein AYO44_12685 [Planctomycetaceae bacterium SCGC AG-212-F19]
MSRIAKWFTGLWPGMTEARWLSSSSPLRLLHYLGHTTGRRRNLLFACACCRQTLHLFADEACRDAVEVTERFADGLASDEERAAAAAILTRSYSFTVPDAVQLGEHAEYLEFDNESIQPIWLTASMTGDFRRAGLIAKLAARAWAQRRGDQRDSLATTQRVRAHEEVQCTMLRCIFGNPFKPVVLDSRWTTPTIEQLAQAIYTDRAFDRLPILADALEDAGCTSADVLGHCRGGGEHVRGCWVVDLLLGKE